MYNRKLNKQWEILSFFANSELHDYNVSSHILSSLCIEWKVFKFEPMWLWWVSILHKISHFMQAKRETFKAMEWMARDIKWILNCPSMKECNINVNKLIEQ